MELLIIAGLFLALAATAMRLFLLHKNIRKLTQEFQEITEQEAGDRRLQLSGPDRELEELAKTMNAFIERSHLENYRHQCQEQHIREEITNISHDLRTPLTSISGYLGLLKNPNLPEEEREAYFSVVERRSRDLAEMIQALYDYARLESREYHLEKQAVNVRKELCDCLLSFYDEFEKQQIAMETEICEEEVWIQADTEGLKRIFYNLITNLLKYHGGVCRISMKTAGKHVQIAFENPAGSLSPYEAEHLFDRFYRAESARNAKGSGLGLTITKMLAEQMGGSIRAELRGDWLRLRMAFPVICPDSSYRSATDPLTGAHHPE
ncbi:MAG: HAMP domain-containing sensor histidine kinase [Eubacteriales bacterium]|nr:HAMP domain-containing sensor histidine kinase [Eubacteriales bacterium]